MTRPQAPRQAPNLTPPVASYAVRFHQGLEPLLVGSEARLQRLVPLEAREGRHGLDFSYVARCVRALVYVHLDKDRLAAVRRGERRKLGRDALARPAPVGREAAQVML